MSIELPCPEILSAFEQAAHHIAVGTPAFGDVLADPRMLVQALEQELHGNGQFRPVFCPDVTARQLPQPVDAVQRTIIRFVVHGVRNLDCLSFFEPGEDFLVARAAFIIFAEGRGEIISEDFLHGPADERLGHFDLAFLLALVHEFQLARHRRDHGGQVTHSGHDGPLALQDASLLDLADQVLHGGDGHARAYAGGLVDELAAPGLEGDLLHCFAQKGRHVDPHASGPLGPGLLVGDGHGVFAVDGVVGQNLRIDPVLERGDDGPAVGIVFRIRREDDHHVQGDPHREPPDLDVLLFHDVQQADLDAGL